MVRPDEVVKEENGMIGPQAVHTKKTIREIYPN